MHFYNRKLSAQKSLSQGLVQFTLLTCEQQCNELEDSSGSTARGMFHANASCSCVNLIPDCFLCSRKDNVANSSQAVFDFAITWLSLFVNLPTLHDKSWRLNFKYWLTSTTCTQKFKNVGDATTTRVLEVISSSSALSWKFILWYVQYWNKTWYLDDRFCCEGRNLLEVMLKMYHHTERPCREKHNP
jgi:hypothetical protein